MFISSDNNGHFNGICSNLMNIQRNGKCIFVIHDVDNLLVHYEWWWKYFKLILHHDEVIRNGVFVSSFYSSYAFYGQFGI